MSYESDRKTDWHNLYFEQFGLCYLCGQCLPRNVSEIHLDHDHRCCPPGKSCNRCRRGLAHRNCNVIAGLAGDSPELLRKIADNLEKARAGERPTLASDILFGNLWREPQ